MKSSGFIEKIKTIPVAILPTMVGAATLSNVYATLGFLWIKHITMWLSAVILIFYSIKLIVHSSVFKEEYSNTVPASLYAGFTMIIMILGSYIFTYNNSIGKIMWDAGLIAHAIHIIIFTYRNVVKGVNVDTFVPSWFVTYNGIMVSTVVGGVMNEPVICKVVVVYGLMVLAVIMPFMLYRLLKHELGEGVFHTQAILLAPSSLCLVSYLNFFKTPNKFLVYALYILILCTLVFIIYKLPKFFSYAFTPGFAGLTFPMAIGIVASTKMVGFLKDIGSNSLADIVNQIGGIQIYITTFIIGYVVLKLLSLIIGNFLVKE